MNTDAFILIILTLLGLCMGSFAGATVWRLRARQLVEDKDEGEPVDVKEYKTLLPLAKATFAKDRSRCLHCEHTLAWYDLLPLASWASTGGTCRYCHKRIGWFEPLMEVGTAVLFVGSFLLWPEVLQTPLAIAQFVLWLVACVFLVILFAYDLRWFLLPNKAMFPLLGVAGVIALFSLAVAENIFYGVLDLAGATVILSGLYFALWWLSKGEWIGFGDVKLGLALALLLGRWELAFIALFAANLVGMLIVLPGLLLGKISRKTHVPFGPLLIIGALISFFVGHVIIDWYMTATIPFWATS